MCGKMDGPRHGPLGRQVGQVERRARAGQGDIVGGQERRAWPTGSNASVVNSVHPVNSAAISQPIPPMWVNGKIRAETSSARMSRHSAMASADAITVRSVCGRPLGSAVVPEV